MSAPRISLSKNISMEGPNNGAAVLTRSPSWVVAFIRFLEPCAMYSGVKADAFKTDSILVVENDCIQVSISNLKNSFAKTCSLTMKVGEMWYQNAVSTGDWVFVWMTEDNKSSERILNWLIQGTGTFPNFKEQESINSYDSGLKFVGRVIGLSNLTSISTGSGQINLTQSISCQAFLEMSNSIYYTYISKALMSYDNPQNQNIASTALVRQNLQSITNTTEGQSNGMDSALTDIASKFLALNEQTKGFTTPEEMIAIMFIVMMGVDREKSADNVLIGKSNLAGSFGDAIGIPATVAEYLGRGSKTKLWQMYNVILGLQSYSTQSEKHPWKSLFPDLNPSIENNYGDVFHRTPVSTKGSVPLTIPPIWDNRTLWDTLNNFLNGIVNEMYTCLRVDKHNRIMPTLVVREKPFSTGLFDSLNRKAAQFKLIPKVAGTKSKEVEAMGEDLVSKTEKNSSEAVTSLSDDLKKASDIATSAKLNSRTFYCNLPRWIIPPEKVISIQTTLDENRRVNFIQVWGRSNSAEYAVGPIWDQEKFKALQYRNGNYVADEADISRSGLRADVQETIYDLILDSGKSLSDLFARMKADWSFNGHLKPYGSITLMGIQEPICEGDNLEYNGVVYHITAVNHSGSVSADGKKNFTTTLQIENGILAVSLQTKNQEPRYINSLGEYRNEVNAIFNLKGKTDIQNTGSRKNRNQFGEATGTEITPKKGKKITPKKGKK